MINEMRHDEILCVTGGSLCDDWKNTCYVVTVATKVAFYSAVPVMGGLTATTVFLAIADAFYGPVGDQAARNVRFKRCATLGVLATLMIGPGLLLG